MATSTSNKSSSDADLRGDIDSLKADIASLKEDLSSALNSAMSEGKASASAAKDKLGEKFEAGTDSLETCITEHPFRSVAIAAGAGLVLGFLYRGR
ncbi:MAG: YqjD family protein [Phycisphaerales bacterium JB063]